MKKFNFLSLMLTASLSALTFTSDAQVMGSFEGNWYADYVGQRVSISSPSSIGGALTYTIANDGSGAAGEWGGAITTTVTQEIVKADPYEACVSLVNAAALNGKIALIKRGNCEFGEKALRAQQAGAIAVIIVNNVAGGPVGMGAGAQGTSVNIPVLMISDVDGAMIDNALGSGTVEMTLSQWASGADNDIAFVRTGLSRWHAQAVPLSQLTAGVSSGSYEGITGAVVGNFGTKPATNVKVKATVSFTPTGGSASVLHTDSVVVAGPFAPSDSIITPFVDMPYTLSSITTTGKVDVVYELSSDSTDDLPGDNTMSYSFDITDNIFSKGRFDYANNRSTSNIAYAFATSSDFMWGNMYYVAKGGYQIESAQFALSQTGGGSMGSAGSVPVFLWKWVDGSNGQNVDNIMVSGEVSLVGAGGHTYQSSDTSGQVMTVEITDPNNGTDPVISEDNTWYWVTVGVPINTFLACDGTINYYVRSWSRAMKSVDSTMEAYSPMYGGTYGTFTSSATEVVGMFPFESYNLVDSVRFSQQAKGTVPSVPLFMSQHPVSVKNLGTHAAMNVELFPNPASDVLNVSVNLDAKAEKVNYTVMDGLGRRVSQDTHENVKSEKYTINTNNLPAGNYYLVINADDNTVVRKFSVVK